MKTNKKRLEHQRRILGQKIFRLSRFNEPAPPSGWIKAVRGALGMTIRQLAERTGVDHGVIAQLEKREPEGKVTLASLERIAQAMDCKLVYAILPSDPKETLESIIERNAIKAAGKIIEGVEHTMRLEAQGTTDKEMQMEVTRIARELKDKYDSRIWASDRPKKTKGG